MSDAHIFLSDARVLQTLADPTRYVTFYRGVQAAGPRSREEAQAVADELNGGVCERPESDSILYIADVARTKVGEKTGRLQWAGSETVGYAGSSEDSVARGIDAYFDCVDCGASFPRISGWIVCNGQRIQRCPWCSPRARKSIYPTQPPTPNPRGTHAP